MSRSIFVPSRGISLTFQSGLAAGVFNPADNTTYFVGEQIGAPQTTTGLRRIYVPAGVSAVTEVSGFAFHANAGVTAEAVTVKLRKNGDSGTDTTIGTFTHNDNAVVGGAYISPFRFTDLTFGIDGGDYIELAIATPNPGWATNPTTVIYVGNVFVS